MITRFNLRVYGIVINDNHEVLVSHERRDGYEFNKFPGGGVELGEGILEALNREFNEELNVLIETASFFYVNDHFQVSSFNSNDQIVSFYYRVSVDTSAIKTELSHVPFGANNLGDYEWVSWVPISQGLLSMMTFPIDKLVAKKLI